MKSTLLSLVFIFGLFTEFSFASHVVGSRITYEYTPGGTIFKVKMYRDCAGINAPSSIILNFVSASNCAASFTTTIFIDAPNSGFQVPFNSCNGVGPTTCAGGVIFAFEEYNYVGVVAVPPCDDWEVSYSECCRNAAITNLVDPDFNNAYFSTTFDNLNYPTNSSPQFNAVPVNYYCAGMPAIIDYSAFDVDGDSLSYEFSDVNGGSSGNPIPIAFISPYTYDQPFATLVPTVFDPVGGQILFTPSAIQISVFGFKVNEYRNGVLIGSVKRDDEVVVVGGFANPDTIAGRVYYDMNANAIFDGGDIPTNNAVIHMGPGNSYTTSASNGKYYFQTGIATNTIEIPNPPPYMTLVPASYTISTFSSGLYYGNNDFALQPTANINDLEVNINNTVNPTPGLIYPVVVNYSNVGTTIQSNVEIVVTLDPALAYLSSVPVPASFAGNVLTYSISNLGLFANGSITIQTSVDTTSIMGDPIICSVTISSSVTDQTPPNNADSFTDEVAAPFDPNNKEVTPAGDLSLAFVTSQQWINYKINFQNLGSAIAQTVNIGDALDIDLDMSTLELVASSTPCTMFLSSPNLLHFNFFGINLPPSSQNEAGSHGFVEYRIKPKASTPLGSLITNNANIVFDFNAPVYTNLVHNKVVMNTGISTIDQEIFNVNVYPNPANDFITVNIVNDREETATLTLNNILGAKVFEKTYTVTPGTSQLIVPVSALNSGIYFLDLSCGAGRSVMKIMVQN